MSRRCRGCRWSFSRSSRGLTEFLPISSSSHLAIVSRVFFTGDAGASFTAVSQLGTEAAVVIYFARDIGRILKAWFNGLFVKAHRDNVDYRMGWYVIIGTLPIVVLGVLFKDAIRGEVRNLWVIATAMLVFSAVIAAAEYFGKQTRHIEQLTWNDGLLVGLAQCLALVPGVSRSGSTISAGLFLGLDRELSARFGFLLGIPAVLASGLFSLPDAFHPVTEGMSATGTQLLVSVVIAFVVGFAAIAWLSALRRPPRHVLVRGLPGGVGARADGAVVDWRGGRRVTVILLRHGRSTSNTAHTLAGRTEGVDLDDKGRDQAEALVERVDGLPIKALCALPAAALPADPGAAGRRRWVWSRWSTSGWLRSTTGSGPAARSGIWSKSRCGRWCSISPARRSSPRVRDWPRSSPARWPRSASTIAASPRSTAATPCGSPVRTAT